MRQQYFMLLKALVHAGERKPILVSILTMHLEHFFLFWKK